MIVHLDEFDRKLLRLLQQDGRLTNNDLAPVWASLLGSRFATHSTEGKSRKHGDARAMLIELDAAGATAYPLDDLIPMNASPRTSRFKPTTLKDLVTEAPWT